MSHNETTHDRPASALTLAGQMRQEVTRHIDTLLIEQRGKALRLAIDTIGTRTDDGAGVVTLAEAYYDFLTAGQKTLER